MLVAGAIAGSIRVNGIKAGSLQADRKILEALELAGANITTHENAISVGSAKLHGFEFDATHCPDLFPPLAALAAHCKGSTIIKGADRLVHKESNRAAALESEMSKLGLDIKFSEDKMLIEGLVGLKEIQLIRIMITGLRWQRRRQYCQLIIKVLQLTIRNVWLNRIHHFMKI